MRRAFTLIELIITTIIIAVIVSLALPMFSDQSGGRLVAAQHRLWADIQYAQAWTIANPSTPAKIKFLSDGYTIEGPMPVERRIRGSAASSPIFNAPE